jgi:hypothetical protein
MAAWCLALVVRTRWRAVGLLLALSPVAVYSTTVVAPNGPEIAAGLLLWCAMLAMTVDPGGARTRRLLALAGLAAALLCLLREIGPGFLVVITGLCVVLAPRTFRQIASRHRRAMAVVVAVALTAFGWHTFWAHRYDGGAPAIPDGREPWKLDQPVGWFFGTVGAFPFRNQPAPSVVLIVFLTIFVSALVIAMRVSAGRLRLILATTAVGVLAMPFVLTAATYSGRGVIWQGRYGLPLAVGVPLLAVLALDRSSLGERFRLVTRASPCVLAVLAAPCVLHVRSMELRRSVSLDDPSWHEPSPGLVVAVVVLSALVVGAAAWSPSPPTKVGGQEGAEHGRSYRRELSHA